MSASFNQQPGGRGFHKPCFTEWLVRQHPHLEDCFTIPPRPSEQPVNLNDDNANESTLCRSFILQEAQTFYEETRGGGHMSPYIVDALTFVLLPPAFLVCTLFSVIEFFTPLEQRAAVKTRLRRVTAPGLPTFTGRAPPRRTPTRSTGANNATNGGRVSRSIVLSHIWALWLVYVPLTRLKAHGGFKGALFPTHSPSFLHAQAKALRVGQDIKANVEAERDKLKSLYRRTIMERREMLGRIDERVDDPDSYIKHLEEYSEKARLSIRVKEWLDQVEKEIVEIDNISETEANMKSTGYRGLADWASDANDSYSNLITAISGVCFLGAGLTYSSIFSAVRGNLGLMCWAFSLFVVGLTVSITVQALLAWLSRLGNYPFLGPTFWELLLRIGLYGAVASVIAAMAVLIVTVNLLQFTGSKDAPLMLDTPPGPAAIFAFASLGSGVMVSLTVFTTFGMSHGLKKLLGKRHLEPANKKSLDDYV